MLKNDNFKEVLSQTGFTLVLIEGDGCANCTVMLPIVKSQETKRDDVKVFHVIATPDTADINEYYQVELVPCVLLLYNGALISKVNGYQPEEIFDIYVDAKIEEYKKSETK